ncbi:hypothetical protein SCHPADRAFT_426211 [Schizopora paradoxa]|uniref:Peptidase C14 caspase domain-containing protein n=1 Tax=Schizopora paradoxa TaxID=27342 RepID=A0A0H2S609_9AGAM|nr:hypothetical protein SCHPADRAFT_426211 [Schizopora paradoxa]
MWTEQYHHHVQAHSFSGHARSPAMHLGSIPSPNPFLPPMAASAHQPSPILPASAAGHGGPVVPPHAVNKLTKSHKHSSSSKPHKPSSHHHSHSHTHVQTHMHRSHKHNHGQAHIPQTVPVHSTLHPNANVPGHRPHRSRSTTQLYVSPLPPTQQYASSHKPSLQMPFPQNSLATTQHFRPEYDTPDHHRQQPVFQYSTCDGRKKALCIGINYYGTNEGDIVILTESRDKNQALRSRPTKENILDAMRWLVQGASPNDSLFFHFSGHGTQIKDLDGDEIDGYDEAIVPLDSEDEKNGGYIIDDEMHKILIRPLPAGCRLTALVDSCNSGTALDLPYIYSHKGELKNPNLALKVFSGKATQKYSYKPGDLRAIIDGMDSMMGPSSRKTRTQVLSDTMRVSPADVICFSGCLDDGVSHDEWKVPRGAMSAAFISTLTKNPNQSYAQLLRSLRGIIREGKYPQKPQLSSSHPIDTSVVFSA